jgi:hypothetical protein
LGVPGQYGGGTPTLPLLTGSPALDVISAGVDDCGTAVLVDQRDFARPFGGNCDIGAFEYAGVLTAVSPVITLSFTTPPTTTVVWSANAANCQFAVEESANPYASYSVLATGLSGTMHSFAGTIGDPGTNTFYRVRATACGSTNTAVSNTVGEFDFTVVPGD